MPKIPIETPVGFLVRRKMRGKRLSAVHSELSFEEKAQKKSELEALEQAFIEELESIPEAEVTALYEGEKQKEKKEKELAQGLYERGLFFNQSAADADFEFWARATYWKLDEAIALSLGKEPKQVSWENIKRYASTHYDYKLHNVQYNASPLAIEYSQRRELATRAVQFNQLYNSVMPGIFIAWLKRNDLTYPQQLEELVKKYGGNVMDWKAAYDRAIEAHNALSRLYEEQTELLDTTLQSERTLKAEIQRLQEELSAAQADNSKSKPQSKRERDTLLKMMIGFAVKGYGYDPKKARSSTPKEFANDLADLGIPVSDDTIRSKLIEAVELLPPEGL